MRLSLQISKIDCCVYAISIGLCFLLFKQSDLTLTNNASFAYLYGHFGDFYDYNRPLFTGNNYLPVFYWIFALWNIPLKLLGFAPEITAQSWMLSTPIQTIWSKLLLAIFFFASVNIVGQISSNLSKQFSSQKASSSRLPPQYLFATSPIAIFAVFIFSGYDIFGVFFTLLGMRAYFLKDFKKFAMWFSIAISFKYFAAFIFLPLVLIIEKRVVYLMLYGLIGLAFSALQFWMYWHSEAFHFGIFGMINEKTGAHGISLRFMIANLVYLTMCAYLYFSKFRFGESVYAWSRRAIFSCILSYALLFSWTLWHPQWLILITPFICLSFLFIRNQKTLLTIETLGYLGFAVFCINNWVGNVDNSMMYAGVFSELLPHTQVLASDLIGRQWMPLSRTLLYASLYAPLLLELAQYAVLWRRKVSSNFSEMPNIKSDISTLIDENRERRIFNIRFLLAAYFFIIISILCIAN